MRMSMWKENGNISHALWEKKKDSKKVQNTVAKKTPDSAKYYVRLEPGTFGMWSENYTSRPKSHMESEGVK